LKLSSISCLTGLDRLSQYPKVFEKDISIDTKEIIAVIAMKAKRKFLKAYPPLL
jgi:hypothetical protein